MKGAKLVFGLDPGSRHTGYGILRAAAGPDGITRIESGTVRLDGSRPFAERLPELQAAILDIIHRIRPDEAVLETCFLSRGVHAALVLGHVRGALLLICLGAGVPVFEYSPSEVKRAVTGTGAASKPQVQRMLRHLVGSLPAEIGDDEADAMAVAYCHFSRASTACSPRALRAVR